MPLQLKRVLRRPTLEAPRAQLPQAVISRNSNTAGRVLGSAVGQVLPDSRSATGLPDLGMEKRSMQLRYDVTTLSPRSRSSH